MGRAGKRTPSQTSSSSVMWIDQLVIDAISGGGGVLLEYFQTGKSEHKNLHRGLHCRAKGKDGTSFFDFSI